MQKLQESNVQKTEDMLADEHEKTRAHIHENSTGHLYENWKAGIIDADLEAKRALDEKTIQLQNIAGNDPEAVLRAAKDQNVADRKAFIDSLKKELHDAVQKERDLEKKEKDLGKNLSKIQGDHDIDDLLAGEEADPSQSQIGELHGVLRSVVAKSEDCTAQQNDK